MVKTNTPSLRRHRARQGSRNSQSDDFPFEFYNGGALYIPRRAVPEELPSTSEAAEVPPVAAIPNVVAPVASVEANAQWKFSESVPSAAAMPLPEPVALAGENVEKTENMQYCGDDSNSHASYSHASKKLRRFDGSHHSSVAAEEDESSIDSSEDSSSDDSELLVESNKSSKRNCQDGRRHQETMVAVNHASKRSKISRSHIDTWNQRFEELRKFKSEHGHCRVSSEFGPLHDWLSSQRHQLFRPRHGQYLKDVAERERRKKELESVFGTDLIRWRKKVTNNLIGIFQICRTQWDQRLEDLKEFKSVHGHCNVPTSSLQLHNWLMQQSQTYLNPNHINCLKHSDERERRTKELESVLGTDLDTWGKNYIVGRQFDGTRWDQSLEELKDFKSVHGHCTVSTSSGPLHRWLVLQAPRYLNPKDARCLKDVAERERRTRELESVLGTDLDTWRKTFANKNPTSQLDGIRWDQRLEELKEFKSVHGHCTVSTSSLQLYNWLMRQSQMSLNPKHVRCVKDVAERERRTRELESVLGIDLYAWRKTFENKNSNHQLDRIRWDQRLEELKEFKSVYGHCTVPTSSLQLHNWLIQQSHVSLKPNHARYLQDVVERERRTKELESVLGTDLGTWGKNYKLIGGRQCDGTRWDQRLEELKQFKSVHGHCTVPTSSGPLHRWLKEQSHVRLEPNHAKYLKDVAERERRTRELESVLGTDLDTWRKTKRK